MAVTAGKPTVAVIALHLDIALVVPAAKIWQL